MTLEYIFSQKYLFDPLPTASSRLYIPLLILFSLCLISSLLIKIPRRLNEKVRGRYFYALVVCGISGFVYLFARYEGLPWLGSRFMLALILAALAIWLLILIVWSIKYIPRINRQKVIEDNYKKYLPKAKLKIKIKK